MVNLQAITWIAFVIWLVIGLVVYFGYSRRQFDAADARLVAGSRTVAKLRAMNNAVIRRRLARRRDHSSNRRLFLRFC